MSILGSLVGSLTGNTATPAAQPPAPAAVATAAPAPAATPAVTAATPTAPPKTRDVMLDIRPGDTLADQLPVIAKAAADPRVDAEIAARFYEIQQKWNETWQKAISSITG